MEFVSHLDKKLLLLGLLDGMLCELNMQLLIPCPPVSFSSCVTPSPGTPAPPEAHTRKPACLRHRGLSEWVQEGWTLLPPKGPLAILCSSAPSHKCRAGHKPTWDLQSKRPGSQAQTTSVNWWLQWKQDTEKVDSWDAFVLMRFLVALYCFLILQRKGLIFPQ